jgi:hypothetical protein
MPKADTSRLQQISIAVTLGLAVLAGVVAWFSYGRSPAVLAISLGCLGGLVHELAQSGGKIMFFESRKDGLYIGSLAGLVLGGVAAILVVRGVLVPDLAAKLTDSGYVNLAYEAFMAGLGLKGIVEATAGTPDAPTGSDTRSQSQSQGRAVITSLPKPPAQLQVP